MVAVVIVAGVMGVLGFVAGWVSAEKASGRVDVRAMWDAQELRHRNEMQAWSTSNCGVGCGAAVSEGQVRDVGKNDSSAEVTGVEEREPSAAVYEAAADVVRECRVQVETVRAALREGTLR
ncbi:hypothetical protein [Pseudonocardia sp. ICBG601]|uniref:hypothetical protein n=1 Tax=Pseudonocardia sp. ICBG601 TaxID=2846759 RepID=UPI001CF63CCB|nr:hypothetical protein [Pseudonocardia sp. ICBG601]